MDVGQSHLSLRETFTIIVTDVRDLALAGVALGTVFHTCAHWTTIAMTAATGVLRGRVRDQRLYIVGRGGHRAQHRPCRRRTYPTIMAVQHLSGLRSFISRTGRFS